MSHISTVSIAVSDVDALEIACRELGVELRRQQKQFRTYGGARNPCAMAIVDPANKEAYEVGVVQAKDGTYNLAVDDWGRGKGMVDKVGQRAGTLLQRYAINVGKRNAAKQGWSSREEQMPDGKVRLICEPKQQHALAGAGGWGGSGY